MTKFFNIRGRGYYIPVMAVRVDPENRFFKQAGHVETGVLLVNLITNACSTFPTKWNDGMLSWGHMQIMRHWETLENGSTINMETE